MEQDLLNMISQFGAAGLIAWMWLTERRHTAKRELQLTESHEQLRAQRIALDQLMTLVADNTRAVTTLEVGQRALLTFLQRLDPPAEHQQPTTRDERTAA